MGRLGVALDHRRGEYGFDAPYVPILLGAGGLAQLAFGLFKARRGSSRWALLVLVGGVWQLASTATYLYTTRVGKFVVWADLLCSLGLRGDEHVLDLGCGRGAVLLMAAALVPRGRAVGIDLWQVSDQSGNSLEVTRRNAELEGVADRVELHTGDMRSLPFPDELMEPAGERLSDRRLVQRGQRSWQDGAIAPVVTRSRRSLHRR